jgi:phosphomannomutase
VAAVEGAALGAVLERLYAEVGRLLSIRVNVPLSEGVRRALPGRMAEPPAVLGPWAVKRVQTTDGLKLHLDGGAWVLVRPSGTEPVARLYVEAPDARTLETLRDAALRHFFA